MSIETLTPAEIADLRKLLERAAQLETMADDAEKMAWLSQLVRKWAAIVLAVLAGLVAFRNDLASVFGWIRK